MDVEQYFARFGWCPQQIAASPEGDLSLVVVVPCHAEPDLLGSLQALWNCHRPAGAAEVIVVLNASAAAAATVREMNETSARQFRVWEQEHRDDRLRFHLLEFNQLPPKHAGVGLARKIGMDEAVRRFARAGALAQGVIMGFDADCGCEATLLQQVEAHFQKHRDCPACSIHFEHPLSGPLDRTVYEAGARYELHLRYYIQALRWAQYPFAFQTIGSSMAVRALSYLGQGGMNKRQAGEDFYFLHKIIPLGGFMDLTSTTIYPSPRPSERVPFGTGRAVRAQLGGEELQTYPGQAFEELAQWLPEIDPVRIEHWRTTAPPALRAFLEGQQFDQAWDEIKANTRQRSTRLSRWRRWLDGFRVMKYVHHARDHFYGAAPVEREAEKLLQRYALPGAPADGESKSKSMSKSMRGPDDANLDLLQAYRSLARQLGSWPMPTSSAGGS